MGYNGRQLTKEAMIQEILITCKANKVRAGGEIFLALAFRTEAELKAICQELHIKTVF